MFRAPRPSQLPSLALMLADLAMPAHQVAHYLEITPRTLQRYEAAGQAPRAVNLALFWETRWGRSAADCEAANFAALHFRRAEGAERQVAALRRQVAMLELELSRAGSGAANSPIWMTA